MHAKLNKKLWKIKKNSFNIFSNFKKYNIMNIFSWNENFKLYIKKNIIYEK